MTSCNSLSENLEKSKKNSKLSKELQKEISYKCLFKETPRFYSYIKELDLNVLTISGKEFKFKINFADPEKEKKEAYWFEKELFPANEMEEIKELRIDIINQYYGKVYTHLAIGEIELYGKSAREYIDSEGKKRLSKWFDGNKTVLVAREFIFGKECRQIDGTRYIFNSDGSYEYITGSTSSTLGSERGRYFFDEQGIRIEFRRFEMQGEDIEDMNYSKKEERILNVRYVDTDNLLIQGNRCWVED
jgi:hypothetical protein